MAPGADGSLYVSIPGRDGEVVALLDASGQMRPGWPILIPKVDGCDLLLPVTDASIRVVCAVSSAGDGLSGSVRRAFAFDASGRPMPGWPVDIEDGSTGRMVGQDLTMLVNPLRNVGGEAGDLWPISIVALGPDGSLRKGVTVPFACCESVWAIGPHGIAYGTTHRDWSTATSVKTDVVAFDLDGSRPGWPVTIDGNASEPAFDAQGRVFMVVGSPTDRPARTVVLDRDGRVVPAGSSDQAIASTSTWNGAGADYPGSPIVADDGSSFIVSTEGAGSRVIALDPNGLPLAGWPYRSSLGMEWTGFCGGEGDTGCGQFRTVPGVGTRNVLYLLHAASSPSTGGSIVAIASDGQVRDGWPVTLRRAGAMFWSMAVAPDGDVWALAIEPESQGYSASVLAIADDSTVLYISTIVEP